MTTIERETDKLAGAKAQGQAQFDSIREMVAEMERATSGDNPWTDAEEARRAIEEDALSVQVRSPWYSPGSEREDSKPAEYEILLCTGGPACRIVGELDEYCQPSTAVLQVQDWFQPWTDFYPRGENVEETLLAYAGVFWFGE